MTVEVRHLLVSPPVVQVGSGLRPVLSGRGSHLHLGKVESRPETESSVVTDDHITSAERVPRPSLVLLHSTGTGT